MKDNSIQPTYSRREVAKIGISAAAMMLLPAFVEGKKIMSEEQERPPSLPVDLVREFVGAAHGDFEKTKLMLAEHPTLLNATYDWSNGDFEMAIGGAGHMGRRDIAEFLISKGARMDLFVAAMLGELTIVKSYLDKYPSMKDSKGPHGIPLMVHAEKGGDSAKSVLDYLKSLEK